MRVEFAEFDYRENTRPKAGEVYVDADGDKWVMLDEHSTLMLGNDADGNDAVTISFDDLDTPQFIGNGKIVVYKE